VHRRRDGVWFLFEVGVYAAGVAVMIWRTADWARGSVIAALLAVFFLFRLASTVTLYRAGSFSVASTSRDEIVAGWLYVARPAAWGATLAAGTAFAMILYPKLSVFIFAGCFLIPGLILLILGSQMLTDWKRQRRTAEQQPQPTG